MYVYCVILNSVDAATKGPFSIVAAEYYAASNSTQTAVSRSPLGGAFRISAARLDFSTLACSSEQNLLKKGSFHFYFVPPRADRRFFLVVLWLCSSLCILCVCVGMCVCFFNFIYVVTGGWWSCRSGQEGTVEPIRLFFYPDD